MASESIIADFFQDRSVFITGSTGFVGKVLVEKLLRSCPKIKRLYLLMRTSPNKDIATRRNELINNQVFSWIDQPNALDKIFAVAGDMTLPGLGISPADMQLLIEDVSIVINSAASVRFDDELKDALQTNVKGPRQLLAICQKMTKLEAFVHVSTAFNNLDRDVVGEMIYPSHIDPIKLINFLESIDGDFTRSITKQLLGKSNPNTYTFSKSLAEQILEREKHNVPLAIVRPSIVTAAAKEPTPGWIDSLYGPTGLIAGGAKGFLRLFKCEASCVIDLIPVDYAVNLIIAVAWHQATTKPSQLTVYTSSTSYHNPITIHQMRSFSEEAVIKYPPKEIMWCPSGECTNRDWYFRINVFLTHYLPAYLLDFTSQLFGKRAKMVKLYERVFRAISNLGFFNSHQWQFVSENSLTIQSKMSTADRKIFDFDVRQLNWRSYFETYVQGIRLFILKDDPSTLPQARKTLVRMYVLKVFLRSLMSLCFVLSVVNRFKTRSLFQSPFPSLL
ncbi:putative fatty acyl-CoA reductase CG5065 [Daphnia pulicaria]|uniref:putative fatty acyl-CoA reductase CG5065 n=1 Tax=Daphnia pulicaria TaxID=35523 RepID=UPI001EEC2357|nr:putative fatty acyl-CoA reductase CG5065 [Daphnia pulicaria]XP_046643603.1 putative fatty acyl-CoA reductase CG5065 [Daphnia pulicaria]